MDIKTLSTNWHFMRWLRLGLGLYFAYLAVDSREWVTGIAAVFFLFQAATNTGCGPSGCSVPAREHKSEDQSVIFKEVK